MLKSLPIWEMQILARLCYYVEEAPKKARTGVREGNDELSPDSIFVKLAGGD